MSEENDAQELGQEQLSNVSGGEDGGFRNENKELIESDDLSEGLLDTKKLSDISGGANSEDVRAHQLEFDPEAKG